MEAMRWILVIGALVAPGCVSHVSQVEPIEHYAAARGRRAPFWWCVEVTRDSEATVFCKIRLDLSSVALEMSRREAYDDSYRRGARAMLKLQAPRFNTSESPVSQAELYNGIPVVPMVTSFMPADDGFYSTAEVLERAGLSSPQMTYPAAGALDPVYAEADRRRDLIGAQAADAAAAAKRRRAALGVAAGLQSAGQAIQQQSRPPLKCEPDPLALTPGTLRCR